MKWFVSEYNKIFLIAIVITITIIPIRISFSQSPDTIEIKTLLEKDDFINSSLHFLQTNVTFSDNSKICPKNNCSYEFQKTTFDERVGIANIRYLSGTIQIEDKTNSDGNFMSYRYYRLSGTFNIVNQKESINSMDKFSIYEGNLLFDTGNAMFNPSKVDYKSQIKLYDNQNRLDLYGKNQ